MEQCVALADYDATVDDEISFRKGDTITVVAKGAASGYWEGELNSHRKGSLKRGLFPNCFVSSNIRANVVPSFQDKALALYSYAAKARGEMSFEPGDVITVLRPSASAGWWCGWNESFTQRLQRAKRHPASIEAECGSSTNPLIFPTNFVSCKVVEGSFAFEGRHSHELTITKGDVILVHRRWNDGWWEGSLNGHRGIFPSNYTTSNWATTTPPFFCNRCKSIFSTHLSTECKECGRNEAIVSSMTTALNDFQSQLLPQFDLFAYMDILPTQSDRTALLTLADSVDRSVRKEVRSSGNVKH